MKTTLLLVMILFASSVKGQTNYYVGAAGVDTPTVHWLRLGAPFSMGSIAYRLEIR
jgi:hypothetical protein